MISAQEAKEKTMENFLIVNKDLLKKVEENIELAIKEGSSVCYFDFGSNSKGVDAIKTYLENLQYKTHTVMRQEYTSMGSPDTKYKLYIHW